MTEKERPGFHGEGYSGAGLVFFKRLARNPAVFHVPVSVDAKGLHLPAGRRGVHTRFPKGSIHFLAKKNRPGRTRGRFGNSVARWLLQAEEVDYFSSEDFFSRSTSGSAGPVAPVSSTATFGSVTWTTTSVGSISTFTPLGRASSLTWMD